MISKLLVKLAEHLILATRDGRFPTDHKNVIVHFLRTKHSYNVLYRSSVESLNKLKNYPKHRFANSLERRGRSHKQRAWDRASLSLCSWRVQLATLSKIKELQANCWQVWRKRFPRQQPKLPKCLIQHFLICLHSHQQSDNVVTASCFTQQPAKRSA